MNGMDICTVPINSYIHYFLWRKSHLYKLFHYQSQVFVLSLTYKSPVCNLILNIAFPGVLAVHEM